MLIPFSQKIIILENISYPSLSKLYFFPDSSLSKYLYNRPMILDELSLERAFLEFSRLEGLAPPTDSFLVVAPSKESEVSRLLEYFRLRELGVPYRGQVSQGLQIVAGALNAAFRFRRSALMKR